METWDKKLGREAGRAGRWVGGRLDTLAALIGGVTAAVAVATGGVESPKDLAGITLAVLSVVAFSLVVERSLRFRSGNELAEVRAELKKVRDDVRTTYEAVSVLDSGTPYHVVESDTTWDIDEHGGVHVERRKRLRFSQEDVVTVIDWVKGDGSVADVSYRPSADGPPIHRYMNDGRLFSLIALDRPYGREEELDFYTVRHVDACFVKTPDRTTVVPLESTSVVKMRVRWPGDHKPRAVRFLRRTDTERQRPTSVTVTEGEDGRPEASVEAQRPERGERLCLEWDWDPPSPPSTSAGESSQPNATGQ